MKRKILLVSLVCLLACLSASAAFAENLQEKADDLVIYFTNDVHGRIIPDLKEPSWGYSRIAQEKKNSLAITKSVLLFSAGDDIQGAPIVNLDQGTNAISFMNAVGYDAMALGNHEFDYGSDVLLQLKDKAKFPMLAANVTRTVGGELVFDANKVFEEPNGMKICVFGLSTPETKTKSKPTNTQGLNIAAGDDLVKAAQSQVDGFKDKGCKLVVVLGHLGIDEQSAPNRSTDILEKVTGIDLFIDGHSHSVENQMVGNTLLVSTGCYGHNLGKIVYDGTKLQATVIPALDEDKDVADLVNGVNDEIQKKLSEVFAKTTVDLNGTRDPGVRTMETNLGDFAADAMLYAAQQVQGDEVVASITNGGGIRASIKAGDITMNDMKTVFPFGNTIAVVQVPGKDLLEVLEAATFSTPKAAGGFPQVAGMKFTVDTTVPYENGTQYPDSTFYAPAKPGSRVTIESVGGKPFDPEALYWIATNDFLAVGGDTYYLFKYSYATSGFNTYIPLEDALIDYTKTVLNGVVGDQYAEPQGRITIK